MPSPTSPARKAKMPRPMTMMPADLKKTGANFVWANLNELNDTSTSIGRVPRTNMVMIKLPWSHDPLESAAICMDWVKPHGKKNVTAPTMNGAQNPFSIFDTFANNPSGNASWKLLVSWNKSRRFTPKIIMTKAAISPRIAVIIPFMARALPTIPSTPPKIIKLTRRPTWKNTNGLKVEVFCDTCAESDRMRPPTTARQVETDAIKPIMSAVHGVKPPSNPKLIIPDF